MTARGTTAARIRRSAEVIGEMVRKEFYQIRQDRRMLGISLLVPFLQVFILGYAATTDIKYTVLAVADQDRSAASRELVRAFTNSDYFLPEYPVDDPRDVERLITSGKVKAALVIPPAFGRDILARRPAEVQMLLDGTDANTTAVVLGYAGQIVEQFGRKASVRLRTAALPAAGAVRTEPRVWFNPELKSSHFMVPGVVALVLMIITMTLTSLGIVREKENGTLEQLMVTPIRPWQLILGKLLPFVVLGFVDMVLVLSVARFWFGVPLNGSVTLLFALSLLFVLTTLGLGLFVSTIARTQQQAMLIAQFFFFMPFLFLSGFAFPIANMPPVIRAVTYVIPLRYFLEIIRGIFLKGLGFADLWPQAAAMLAIGVAVLTVSVLRFRKTLA